MRQRLGQHAAALGRVDGIGGIVGADTIAIEKAEELAQRGQLARLRGTGKCGKTCEVALHIVANRVLGILAALDEEAFEVQQIAAIGRQRVDAGAALGAHHVEEGLEQMGIAGRFRLTHGFGAGGGAT